jgi:adenosylmethionine-8-amino-7-oxononanoate aminotransferase
MHVGVWSWHNGCFVEDDDPRKQAKKNWLQKTTPILVVPAHVYGSAIGGLAAASCFSFNHNFGCGLNNIHVLEPVPLVEAFGTTLQANNMNDRAALTQLQQQEAAFITALSARFHTFYHATYKMNKCIFFFEPIAGADGVWTFRPSFLIRVRQLCDQFKVHRSLHA